MPLEQGMATHFSILAWKIPMDRGAWGATVHRVTKGRTRLKQLSTHTRKAKTEEETKGYSEDINDGMSRVILD